MSDQTENRYYFSNFSRRFRFPKKTYNLNIKNYIDGHLQRLESGARILDASCGDGYLTRNYLGKYQVHGFDCEKEAVEYCQKEYPQDTYFLTDVYRIPIEDGFFDGVVSSMAIEHYSDPGAALRELRRVMKNEGIIVIITPNEDSLLWKLIKHTWFRFFEGTCKPYRKDVHPSPFREQQLHDLVGELFELVETRRLTYGTTLAVLARK